MARLGPHFPHILQVDIQQITHEKYWILIFQNKARGELIYFLRLMNLISFELFAVFMRRYTPTTVRHLVVTSLETRTFRHLVVSSLEIRTLNS